jgi:hypothetical protein
MELRNWVEGNGRQVDNASESWTDFLGSTGRSTRRTIAEHGYYDVLAAAASVKLQACDLTDRLRL